MAAPKSQQVKQFLARLMFVLPFQAVALATFASIAFTPPLPNKRRLVERRLRRLCAM
jgi:hypothetical protein